MQYLAGVLVVGELDRTRRDYPRVRVTTSWEIAGTPQGLLDPPAAPAASRITASGEHHLAPARSLGGRPLGVR